MSENEALNTLHILLAHEKAIDAGEIVSPNNLHSQEKEALQFILEEFKALKEKNETLKALYYDARKEGANLLANERAKAIDEFAERLKLKYPYFVEDVGFVEANKMLHSAIDEITEEMRGAE